VTGADRFIALLVTVITGTGIIMTGVVWTARMLWNVRGSWDTTNTELKRLVDRVGDMRDRDEQLDRRLERHLEWHDKH